VKDGPEKYYTLRSVNFFGRVFGKPLIGPFLLLYIEQDRVTDIKILSGVSYRKRIAEDTVVPGQYWNYTLGGMKNSKSLRPLKEL